MSYIFDKDKNIYTKPQRQNFAYSDGDVIENYIYETLKKARDVSSHSQELFSYIKDWPSLYHFSPQRFSLLRPFTHLFQDKTVLEIGSGCGAITRGLVESGANVVALEGSLRRAQISAERCRDLENVKVYCDNFQNFEINEKFDVVTLIGVLEYSCIFINSAEPVLDVLKKAKSFLKEDGILIIAIENKLGIKYFNGAPEDHLYTPYSGIQNLYPKNGPVTFGKKELEQQIKQAGFPEVEIHYPFPDYKLPAVVLHPAAFNCPDFKVDELLLRATSTFDSGFYHQSFSEGLVFESLHQNRLIQDLANSFLVFTKKDVLEKTELANGYSVKRRKPFAKAIKFCLDEGKIITKQHRLFLEESTENDLFEYEIKPTEEYISGQLFFRDFCRLVKTNGWTIEQLVSLFKEWLDYIAGGEYVPDNALESVDPSFIDCLPFNMIRTETGLITFDLEYRWKAPLKLNHVAFRCVCFILMNIQPFAKNDNVPDNTVEFSKLLLTKLGIEIDDDEINAILQSDFMFQSQVCMVNSNMQDYVSLIYDSVLSISIVGNKVSSEQDVLDQIYTSRSWRYTAPLRRSGLLARKILKYFNLTS